jgi:hypothetical protein
MENISMINNAMIMGGEAFFIAGRESFMIVGSHSKFPKEGGPSDLISRQEECTEEEDRSQASDLSVRIDHRWIMKNLHVH